MSECRIIEFIFTSLLRKGEGKDDSDPVRIIEQYWTKDGKLVFEVDTWTKEVKYYE